MSNHIITKSKMIVDGYVDAAVIGTTFSLSWFKQSHKVQNDFTTVEL